MSRENGLVADLDYEDKATYPFTGTVKKVVFDLKPKPTTSDDEVALHEHESIHAVTHGVGA